ncbi:MULTISPECIES: SRPBCC family protein [Pseudomonas]|uniref:SRPBCC family protein n=1 Tax=Pseudomonas TaxID=286 RepID=UPI0015A2F2CD|nr:SRPBCC family protein [Pseudomonas gingeri]NVZ29674.1 SRPBCC family protein [Pseudomonas gingeri]NVZ65393.1 SRPBCC family protein [Pseudomonas gingeri]NVZ78329.1 SRPBCC family protein [Pseudomonas gingeri]NWA08480.1 SRPBCC family protein [Pseudomonas gingeri]NWE50715.1 SRPBCC family protein [Pseudomonas gingeri]
MAATSVTIEIPATPEQVWQLMGGFDSLPDWLPFIPRSSLSEGGRVRTLQTADGGTVVERLEAFDNRARRYSYSIEQAPFPATDYLATLQVREGSTPQTAIVEWAGIFTPVGVSEEEVVALFHGIYSGGLAALKANFPD